MSVLKGIQPSPKKLKPSHRSFAPPEGFTPVPFETVEWVEVDLIEINTRNPREHPQKQLHVLAQTVSATGVLSPLMLGDRNQLLAGHARLAVARMLGLKRVPVVRAPNLTEAQKQVFILADNQVATLGNWNDHLLAVVLKDIGELDFDFSIEATGFEHAEIDIRIDSLKEQPDPSSEGDDAADALPAPLPRAVTQAGDIWIVGPHRLICGDSLQSETYVRLMQGGLADMVMQDAPYNVSVKKHVGGLGKIQHREFAIASGELSKPEFAGFLGNQLNLAAEHCRPGAVLASFMDWRSIALLILAGEGIGLELINMCVWGKTNASMGSLWRSQYELIAMFKKPGASVTNNVQLGKFGRNRTNLWIAPGANSFGEDRKELVDHPTPKNVALVADAIRDVTNRGDIVLDNFLGSGTTAVACERTGRIARCIELDPVYVDVAVRRLEAFSGLSARLEATGQTFAEVMAERANANAPVINPRPRQRTSASA